MDAGGSQKMIPAPTIPLRQQKCKWWSLEHLHHERALALGEAIDASTRKNYGSALNSYLNFVLLHHLPVKPTDDTLSLYVIYTASYIKPNSVDTYLSGISHQLEFYFPDICKAHSSPLIKRTLHGCKQLKGSATMQKRALTLDDLGCVIDYYSNSTKHDDLLFIAMLLTGFFALMRLGELTFPDNKSLVSDIKGPVYRIKCSTWIRSERSLGLNCSPCAKGKFRWIQYVVSLNIPGIPEFFS